MDSSAQGKGGSVASGDPRAVEAGINILEGGGNAIDAAVATLLALSITDYGMFAIGGEVPLMFYEGASGRVRVLGGLGRAPADPDTIEWFLENGIPSEGDLKASPVPGALDLCTTALRLYGSLSFKQTVAPALALLDERKESWHEALAATLRLMCDAERGASGDRLSGLTAASDRFYRGDIADGLVDFYTRNGGFLRKADLAAHVTTIENPVAVKYRSWTIHKCGTWTQGPCLCEALRLLEGFDLKKLGHLSADYIHIVVEALKLALADRDAYYADPDHEEVPLQALLSAQYTDLRRSLIDDASASRDIRPGDPVEMRALATDGAISPGVGGTTTCVTSDRFDNVVAATPSCNPPYSVCEELGIAHGNRLRSFNTSEGHPNRIEPGKRPRITLTPTIVVKPGHEVIAISVAGGDLQDQTALNCLLNRIEFGMSAEDAVNAPRFSTGQHLNSFNPDPRRKKAVVRFNGLNLNAEIGDETRELLRDKGHSVTTIKGAIARPVMLLQDLSTGLAHVAGDRRAQRHAKALPE